MALCTTTHSLAHSPLGEKSGFFFKHKNQKERKKMQAPPTAAEVKRRENPLLDPTTEQRRVARVLALQRLQQQKRSFGEDEDREAAKEEEAEPRAREARRDVPATAELRADTLHVYGTDRASTDDLFAYFAAETPVWVEWLDDSSANVVFVSDADAARALHAHALTGDAALSTPARQDLVVDPETMQVFVSARAAENLLLVQPSSSSAASVAPPSSTAEAAAAGIGAGGDGPIVPWVRAVPLRLPGTSKQQPLLMRVVTVLDTKAPGTAPTNSAYYGRLFEKIKKRKQQQQAASAVEQMEDDGTTDQPRKKRQRSEGGGDDGHFGAGVVAPAQQHQQLSRSQKKRRRKKHRKQQQKEQPQAPQPSAEPEPQQPLEELLPGAVFTF